MVEDLRGDWEHSFADLEAFISTLGHGMVLKCKCGTPGWNSTYTHHLKALQRFRLTCTDKCYGCKLKTGLLEDGLHLLCRVMPRDAASLITTVYYMIRNRAPDMCIHNIHDFCKEMSGLVKRAGRFLHSQWRVLTHWEMMLGYSGYKGFGELRPQVEDWLVNRKHIGEDLMGEREYVTRVYQEAKKFMLTEWQKPKQLPSIGEWVSNGTWMRGKAGTGGSNYVVVEGRRRKTRAYKGVDAVKYSDNTIASSLTTPTTEEMIVMQKAEGAKVRPVVKTGNALNKKQDFLSELIEKGLYGSTASTLFAGGAGNEKIDEEWLDEVRNGRGYIVPLDQSGFDQHQSKSTIMAVLHAIGDVCIERPDTPLDYKLVWKAMWDTLFDMPVKVIYDGRRYDWGNGVPSGWRWTALLDTVLNISSLRVLTAYIAQEWGRNVTIDKMCAQGDDVLLSMPDRADINRLIQAYNQAGYEVHPQKTYLSKDRGEFLRRSYEREGITGYITRTQLAIRFRNPIIEQPISAAERLPSRIHLWMLFRSRGALAGPIARCMVEDAQQAGVDADTLVSFCSTPSSVGGIGMSYTGDSVLAELRKMHPHASSEWITPVVTKPSLKLLPNIGQWAMRLARRGIRLNERSREKFHHILAQTWGMRQADITGKVQVQWIRSDKIKPLKPRGGEVLPKGVELWDMTGVPALVRPIFKQQCIDDGSWTSWIKPQYQAFVQKLQKNMTTTVFRIYMLDLWKVPSVILDRVHPKYGAQIKKEAEKWILRFFSRRHASVPSLTGNLLWLEHEIENKLRAVFKGMWLAL